MSLYDTASDSDENYVDPQIQSRGGVERNRSARVNEMIGGRGRKPLSLEIKSTSRHKKSSD